MAKTFSELQALALQIRDEILEKKNTAPRVGAALLDMIDNTIQNITDINQKLSVFEHVCSGFKRVQSESQLPVTPPEDEKAVGYLVGKNLYLYVGKDGNAVNGRYFNVGDITGPQGELGPQGLIGPVGPKGEQGNSGVSGSTDNIEVVNNLDGGESTPSRIKVLAAEQGKVLKEKLSELETKFESIKFIEKTGSNNYITIDLKRNFGKKLIFKSPINDAIKQYSIQYNNNDGVQYASYTGGSDYILESQSDILSLTLYIADNNLVESTTSNVNVYWGDIYLNVNDINNELAKLGNKENQNSNNITNLQSDIKYNSRIVYTDNITLNAVIKELYIVDNSFDASAIYSFAYFRRKWGNPTAKWTIYIKRNDDFVFQFDSPESPENNSYFDYNQNDLHVKAVFDWSKMDEGSAINDVLIDNKAFDIKNSPYIFSKEEIDPLHEEVIEIKNIQNGGKVVEQIALTYNYYIRNDKEVGDAITISKIQLENAACGTMLCREGDIFKIYGKNGHAGRAWCFIDKNNKILSIIEGNADVINTDITAPINSYMLIVNFWDVHEIKAESYRKNNTIPSIIDINTKPLFQSNILLLGDSNTEFSNAEGYRYSDYLQEMSLANIINGGIGGTKLRCRKTFDNNPQEEYAAYGALDIVSLSQAFLDKNWEAQKNAANWIKENLKDDNVNIIQGLSEVDLLEVDIVAIMGGTNDFGDYETKIGEVDSTDVSTTAGALNIIIKNFLTVNPKLKLYIITPIPRYYGNDISNWDDSLWCDNYQDGGAIKVVDIIKAVAKKNRIPVCDLFNTIGWNKYNFKQYFFNNDGTHAYNGYKEIARRINYFITNN